MKIYRLQALATTLFVTMSVSPSFAQPPTDEMAKLMQDGLNQYAKVAGEVASCTSDNPHRMDYLAKRIAAWRYPGWWDELTGTRDAYADDLLGIAYSYYLSTVAGPCPGLPALYQDLADTMVRQIERETEPER